MKYLKIFITLTLALLSLFLLTACQEEGEQSLDFMSNGDGTCYVSGLGTYAEGDVVIPEKSPEGDTVTGIGNYAFRMTDITSVTMPDTVTSIGGAAFYRCEALARVEFSEQLSFIGFDAFYQCLSLTEIELPAGVVSLSDNTFYGCHSLVSVVLPDGMKKIGESAFYGCTSLSELRAAANEGGTVNCLPESLETIGKSAFYGCRALADIELPVSLMSIGLDAFNQCTSLRAVYTADLVSWCDITFYNAAANPLYCGEALYVGGELMTRLVLPENVVKLKDHAFVHCTSMAEIVFHNKLQSIGLGAFQNCTSLTDVYFTVKREELPNFTTGNLNESLSNASIHYPEDVENTEK